ncbi:MAG: hypothetical protein H6585_14140 [Flavobacteriales bacterium]|nr:hypothetical protein [Flavobacteriales bacterium]MCB9449470.1 hypothetical protein [Flavobacteriales bacterium]
MNKRFAVLLLLLFPILVNAQRWKRYRYEGVVGVGVSNFLGELGGANQVGTDYFRDLELSTTRPAIMVGVRYKLNLFTALRTTFTYAGVAGNDNLTTEPVRSNRNLHFKSPIYEFSSQFEFSWMKDRAGHRYRLKGVRGQTHIEIYTYGFVGLGVFHYNPKAKWDVDGAWHSLQPLHTEGQDISSTRVPYSRFSVAVPIGMGGRYALGRNASVGLEFGIRKTFTDYIDDVSTTYYNNDAIRSAGGDVAGDLADPSKGKEPNWTAAGQQRGDPTDKDAYMFAILSFNYKLRTTRGNLPKF